MADFYIGEEIFPDGIPKEWNDDQLLAAIIERVTHMLDRSPELLFSYLYRLDISEAKIAVILQNQGEATPGEAIGYLIWERQKQRMETKLKYKQEPFDDWDSI